MIFQRCCFFNYSTFLTFSDHTQLHLLLHHHILFILRYKQGAVECAAVGPRVIECDVVQVNCPDLDVAGQGSLPL